MSAELEATESEHTPPAAPRREPAEHNDEGGKAHPAEDDINNDDGDEDDDEEEEEEEPRLKYAKLTGNLTSVYRNGDSTSASLVAGDKMLLGTHNGGIHVLEIPALQSLRTVQAHQATVTSLSISPVPPPPYAGAGEVAAGKGRSTFSPPASIQNEASAASLKRNSQRPQQNAVPNIPRNQIYVATSSLDGHVCVFSLTDPDLRNAQRRNFARPVNAVALSPDFKNDRTYLSGGLAGQLILTEGGKAGTTDANTNSAAAAASGWLGGLGLGGDRGKDRVLHSGEGAISTIKWSLSGKWIVWMTEEGIKFMRSHLRLGSEDSEHAWTRIAHAEKPNREAWEGMAGVWKGRCEWVDERFIEADDDAAAGEINGVNGAGPSGKKTKRSAVEKLVVGWGDTAWLIHVQEGGVGRDGKPLVGKAEVIHKMQFVDCVISGISLFTPTLLAVLAWRTRDDDDEPIQQNPQSKTKSPRKGRSHRHTGLAPQLRLVNVTNGSEVDLDELSISRFEMLSSQDYHLGALYIPPPPKQRTTADQRGTLENLFDAAGGKYAARMFSSSASVMSGGSSGQGDGEENGRGVRSPQSSATGIAPPSQSVRRTPPSDAHPYASSTGLKLFIQSPYDCVLAVKRDLSDHLEWLLEHQQFADAWEVIDKHPEVVELSSADQRSLLSDPNLQRGAGDGSLADFFADDTSMPDSADQRSASAVQREKLRIGDLWLRQLVAAQRWREAGQVAGRVLGTSPRWEHWVFTFAQADHFDEITPYIPSTQAAHLPSQVYEVVLGYYIKADPAQVSQLIDQWDVDLFDGRTVISAIESRLHSGEISMKTVEDGVRGRDWRILTDVLAKLYLADGRSREALRCYIRVQDADAALRLIKDEKMMDAVADDIPGLLLLRVDDDMLGNAPLSELEDVTREAIQILVEEADRGNISTSTVVKQLLRKGENFRPFLYFYLRELWTGGSSSNIKDSAQPRLRTLDRRTALNNNRALVDRHADLTVELFAEYNRPMLMDFLKVSSEYSFDKAISICKTRGFTAERVHILAKTGQIKDALRLIIDELDDVGYAIEFAKENPDLWEDLVEYSVSMRKPRFIRGLLEEAGTAIDPIDLIQRLPERLEIEGLRESVVKMMRDYDIQHSIAEGAAKVLRGEVAAGMDTLRAGRKKAVRFDVVQDPEKAAIDAIDVIPGTTANPGAAADAERNPQHPKPDPSHPTAVSPGHCAGCGEAFTQHETEPLLGFPCAHITHLSCHLRAGPAAMDESGIDELESQLGYRANSKAKARNDADDDEYDDGEEDPPEEAGFYAGRTVGAKVAHAHVIRRAVEGGCRVCGAVT